MLSTKDKILLASVDLFNARGFVNVTLRDIAADTGISPGNLAYHFRNKDVVLLEIYERMAEELAEKVSNIRRIPSFENIDYEITPFLEFQYKYRFFYLDALELCRAYPEIAERHREQGQQQIAAIRAVIQYSVERGNMVAERVSGTYDRLAHTVWMLYSFWLSQALLLGGPGAAVADKQDPPSPELGALEARRSLWNLVLPYLTAKGKNNFETVAHSHGLTENKQTDSKQTENKQRASKP
jgi:AcrR family transcriptional regulator